MNKSGQSLQELFEISDERMEELISFITNSTNAQSLLNSFSPVSLIEGLKNMCETEDELLYSMILLGIAMA